MAQTKRLSLIEAITSTTIGFGINVLLNYVVFGWYLNEPIDIWQNLSLTIFFTATSLMRSYGVRRIFNSLR